MPCTYEQILANKRNATMLTGPRTPEGKARSRANSLKHGLTGAGVVLPVEDGEEIDRRYATIVEEMKPRNEAARQMLKRFTIATVKLDRGDVQEARAIAERMRLAIPKYDDARLADAESFYSWIAAEPATNARRLRTTPEGIDRILKALEEMRADLVYPEATRWTWQHCEHFHHLTGRRRMDVPVSRPRALTDAVTSGDFRQLHESDRPELAKLDRQCWAAVELVKLVDEEIAALKALRAGLDLESLELGRSEAPDRAMFDDSKEGILARKYNASNERAMFRSLREFNELQDRAAEAEAGSKVAPEAAEELGSSLPEPSGDEDESPGVDPALPEDPFPARSEPLSPRDRADFEPSRLE